MNGNIPLDYAEFRLSPSHQGCELYLAADGVYEELASGNLTAFLVHLNVEKLQVSMGGQFIRMELPHQKAWFTKSTLERFVRFVLAPDILERVCNLEVELSHLEQVRTALAKTLLQSSECCAYSSFPPAGPHEVYSQSSMMMTGNKLDEGSNASKEELLRVMDIRLIALFEEQDSAFACAAAAGFSDSSMADFMAFAQHFGAESLRELYMQFIVSLAKRKMVHERDEQLDARVNMMITSHSDLCLGARSDRWAEICASATDSDENILTSCTYGCDSRTRTGIDGRKRWGPLQRLQIMYSESEELSESAEATETEIDIPDFHGSEDLSEVNVDKASGIDASMIMSNEDKQLGEKSESGAEGTKPLQYGKKPICQEQNTLNVKTESIAKGDTFFARLQQMTQQIELRKLAEKLNGSMCFTSVAMNDESPVFQTAGVGTFATVLESLLSSNGRGKDLLVDKSNDSGSTQNGYDKFREKSQMQPSIGRKLSVGPEGDCMVNTYLSDERLNLTNCFLMEARVNNPVDDEVDNTREYNEEPQQSTSSRRLSVQAAISLFESKSSFSNEPSPKKVGKDKSHTIIKESGKTKLRRWSIAGYHSLADDSGDKINLTSHSKDILKDGGHFEIEEEEKVKPSVSPGLLQQASKGQKQMLGEEYTLCRNSLSVPPIMLKGILLNSSGEKHFKSVQESMVSMEKTSRVDEVDPANSVVSSGSTASAMVMLDQHNKGLPPVFKLEMEIEGVEFSKRRGQQNCFQGVAASIEPLATAKALSKFDTSCHDYRSCKFDPFPEGKQSNGISQIARTKDCTSFPRKAESMSKEVSGDSAGMNSQTSYVEALVNIANCHDQTFSEVLSLSEQRGRFYEQYHKLRDRRLRDIHPAKRAERESKLRFMKETLDRRKFEMDLHPSHVANNASSLEKSQMRGANPLAHRSGLFEAETRQMQTGCQGESIQGENSISMRKSLYDDLPFCVSKAEFSGKKPPITAKRNLRALQRCVTSPGTTTRSLLVCSMHKESKSPAGGSIDEPAMKYNKMLHNSVRKSVSTTTK